MVETISGTVTAELLDFALCVDGEKSRERDWIVECLAVIAVCVPEKNLHFHIAFRFIALGK